MQTFRPRALLPAIIAAAVCSWCFAEQEAIESVFAGEILRLRSLLRSALAERRLEGVRGMAFMAHYSVEGDLLPLLGDADPVVRRETVYALGKCGGWRSIPGLIRSLGEERWDVREHAHAVLCLMTAQDWGMEPGKWDHWWRASSREEKVNQLLGELKTDDVERRKQALGVLHCLASAEDEGAVLDYVQSRPKVDRGERKLGIALLERIGTAKSVPYLAAHGRVGNTDAAWALGQVGGEEAEKALLAGFAKGRWENRPYIFSLDRIQSGNCEPFFSKLLYAFGLVSFRNYPDDLDYRPSPLQRAAANLILRTGKAPDLVDAILAELEGKPRNLGEPLKQVFEAMRQELKPGFVRNDGLTTSQPLAALPHIAQNKALITRLVPLLKHQAFVPRVYVAMTLGRLQAREAIPEILKIIDEGYPFSDSTAVASGKHFKRSQTVRWKGYFAIALGWMQCDEARLALEKLAADSTRARDIRYGAVVGLDFMTSPESLPVLKKVAAEDIIWMIRQRASEAMRNIELTEGEGKCP